MTRRVPAVVKTRHGCVVVMMRRRSCFCPLRLRDPASFVYFIQSPAAANFISATRSIVTALAAVLHGGQCPHHGAELAVAEIRQLL
jgi:hypothetical protein